MRVRTRGPLLALLMISAAAAHVRADDATIRAVPPRLLARLPHAATAAEWRRATEARVHAGDMLRVRGSFGEFTGTVGAIDESGLSQLRPDTKLDPSPASPHEPIAWSEIESVERRGHSAGRGAAIGAIVLGGLASAAGGTIGAAFGDDDQDIVGGLFAGAMIGGPVGALAGALIGRAFPAWHRIEPESPTPR